MSGDSGPRTEQGRIAAYYQRRAAAGLGQRYSLSNRGNLYRVQRLERDLLDILARHGFADLSRRSMLDVGCGDGWFLRRLMAWGGERELLSGVDLLPERIAAAQHAEPDLDLRCADAGELPYADETFNLVFQLTVLSSILDDDLQRAVAMEIARVLKRGGAAVSYDFHIARDRRNTRPVRRSDLAALFPGFQMDARRVTLVPPLARALAGRCWLACELLETIPLLRTHELAVLTKP